jgi:hypothetical protein
MVKRYEDLDIKKMELDMKEMKVVLEFETEGSFEYFLDFMNEEL